MSTRWATGPPKKVIHEYSLATPIAEIESLTKTKCLCLCVFLCRDLTTTAVLPSGQFCEVFLAKWEEYGCSQKYRVLKNGVVFCKALYFEFPFRNKREKNLYMCFTPLQFTSHKIEVKGFASDCIFWSSLRWAKGLDSEKRKIEYLHFRWYSLPSWQQKQG